MSMPSSSGCHSSKEDKVVKIYERKELPGIPEITIINEKKSKYSKKSKKKKDLNHQEESPKFALTKHNVLINKPILTNSNYETIVDTCREKIINKSPTKLALFQVSDIQSGTSSDYVSIKPSIVRSRSSPDILQNSFGDVALN